MLSLLLAVPSCIYSFWHGVIPTSYFIFNDFYTCTCIGTQWSWDSEDVSLLERCPLFRGTYYTDKLYLALVNRDGPS